ncbi:AzlD domain-containing protein [Cellulomonas triticagri]|uniref:AzlD domain-containing protein n=1 Tax=Cellulomonas triticagri TaxID=2483352 RepID=A0A3M2J8L7_9CELL|nr:AzlD domain-containing protein [Cellulomonas triticagri]RMI09779.1 AzlD domain-containing protein [Cellulomonas triticagri]
MSRVAVWWAVVAASVVVLATKVAGHLVPARLLERPRVTRTAALVTVALLAALVAVQVGTTDGSLVLDARVAALVVAAVALLLRAPFVLVVVLAAATAALLRWLGLP